MRLRYKGDTSQYSSNFFLFVCSISNCGFTSYFVFGCGISLSFYLDFLDCLLIEYVVSSFSFYMFMYILQM